MAMNGRTAPHSRGRNGRGVFLDKDGTLIEDVPYSVDAARMQLADGAEEGLSRLSAAGYLLFVVSNQSGVARGYFEESALEDIEAALRSLLRDVGVDLTGFAYCPHHPAGKVERYRKDCGCRKPKPGLIVELAERHGIDLAQSWVIGDILDDVEAGRRAGCRTVLVDRGHETQWVLSTTRIPHHIARDLRRAAEIVLEESSDRWPSSGTPRTGARS
jgi:D-glycero-D-manno-heptose 1,7-bisphosphate phosphatase